jgi:hypothetical protein
MRADDRAGSQQTSKASALTSEMCPSGANPRNSCNLFAFTCVADSNADAQASGVGDQLPPLGG